MADNTQNTGPDRDKTKQIISDTESLKKGAGDFNDILKDSINLLKKIDRSYESIQAKISSLDKTQINIKQISNELYKAKQKEFTVSKQLLNSEKLLGADSLNRVKQYSSSQSKLAELEKRKVDYERSALKAGTEAERAAFLDKSRDVDLILNKETARNLRLQDGLSIQEAQVVALKEADRIAKSGVDFGKESLDIEKQTSKQLGISGNLVKGLATKLGVGTEAYEAMTTEARRLVEEDKKRKDLQKELSELNIKEAVENKKRADVAQALVVAQQAGNQDKVKSLNAQLALMDKQKAGNKDQSKSLKEQLDSMGKEKGAFSKKMSVIKEGFKAGKAAIRDNLSDPAVLAGGLAAGAVGAYKLAQAGLDGIGNAAASAGNFMAGLSEDSGNVVRGLTSGVSDLARKIPLVGGLIGGLIDGFSALLDLVLGVDNMIVKTGRQLNLSAEGARNLYRNLAAASQASGDIYMNGKKYLESQLELTQQLGVANVFSAEILRTNVRLKDFAGLEADTRARIAETAQITGKSAEGTVKSVLSQVKGLERATGVSLQYQQVLKEVSNLGGYLGLQFAKYPDKLAKAFVTTKALGLELKQLDGMASSFLDFESSISKEFEAQLLTGKDINLSKARELFLNNDLAGAAAEIAKHTGDAAGYSKMNRIQQDSLAEAMGMSRDQMADMLKQQELYSKFGVKNREDLLKQVDSLRKAGKEQEAINKAGGEGAYNDLVRASAQEKLALTIEKIKQSIVEFVERSGIIEKVEAFVDKLSNPDTIKGIIGTIRDTMSTFIKFAGEMLADVIEVGGEIANFFTFGKKGDQREAAAYELGAQIRAGSSEMSNRIAGTGNYSGGSVSDAAAKDKLKTEPAAAKTPDNSMSMAKPPETKVYVLNQMNVLTGKALTVPIEEGMYFAQGGQVGKGTTG
jgi:hypothetical protein